MPRDGGGTENIQKSANEAAVKNKIYKHLQMKLPSKKENAKNCKNDFPVFCIFTFVNADFCRFLQSLRSE